MRVIVTGGNGQLGRALRDILSEDALNPKGKGPKISTAYIDVDELDITDREAVDDYFARNPCDALINCAAYTAVDKAESEPLLADAINREAVKNLAVNASRHNFKIIHISTDYVFDGESDKPYKETERPNPKTVYGISKLLGEGALMQEAPESIIIRTAWLYSPYGRNFFLTMKGKASDKMPVRVVSDQTGTPTSAHGLALAIKKILFSDKWISGIYHYTDEGVATWYDFTREIYRMCGAEPELVTPIKSEEYPVPAPRPKYSVLDKTKIKETYNIEIPHWKESLHKLKTNGTE